MDVKTILKKLATVLVSLFMGVFLTTLISHFFPQLFGWLPQDTFLRNLIGEAICAAISIVIAVILNRQYVFKVNSRKLLEGIGSVAGIIILNILIIIASFTELPGKNIIPVYAIVCNVIVWFLIGIFEETLFRGIIQEIFMEIFGSNTRKGVILSIVCSSVIFGMTHFQNMLFGVEFKSVVLQAMSAISIGLVFGALFFRSDRSIWPCVVLHAIIDAAGFMSGGSLWGESEVDILNQASAGSARIVVAIIFVAIFVFMMRKRKTEALIK